MMYARLLLIVLIAGMAGGAFAAAGQARPPLAWAKNAPDLFGPNDFPLAVWLQDPQYAGRYRQAGFNLYVGLWQGPTEAQLAALRAAGMPVICAQNAVGLAHRDDPTVVGWMHQDEPDNAQAMVDPATGKTSYGPFIPPAQIVAEYDRFRANDPTRPVMLNLGQGVANDAWIGRGSGASLSDYPKFIEGCDIVSFDVYPVAGLGPDGANLLWDVPQGVDRLTDWSGGKKSVWTCIECTHIGDPKAQATPGQVRAEVWMALIHGARGLIYFVHQFQPRFDEHALLDDPKMLAAVTAINTQIHSLAPVLNSPALPDAAGVVSSSPQCPVDITVRHHAGAIYLFAVGMRNAPTQGTFTIHGLPSHITAEVLAEGRTIPVRHGQFTDSFGPYAVHLYRIHG